jgi:YfiH family protein
LSQGCFEFVSRDGVEWLECSSLGRQDWLLHAFSTRRAGGTGKRQGAFDLGLAHAGCSRGPLKNRKAFLLALGAQNFLLAELQQIHSANCYQVIRRGDGDLEFRPGGCSLPPDSKEPRARGDVLLTNDPGILLAVRTADCAPLLVADPRRRAIAAVHVGWRGALLRVAEIAAGEMSRLFGSSPQDLWAVVGPSIRACCYEVGEEVVELFSGAFRESEEFFCLPRENRVDSLRTLKGFLTSHRPASSRRSPGVARLDLVAVIHRQLQKAGLQPFHIRVAEFCTACRTDLFFSVRKEGSRAGRMMGLVGLRPSPVGTR